ncbi:hypothetical protein Pfo_001865 [Paulownia fortunei]|nr:hypothetical protein Pfo_001865 [Paulownia fortunei]
MAKRGRGRPKNTVSGDSAEFFKVFLPHLSSQQLRIPPDFIKDFKRTIKERVILKDISGKMWYVDVEETPKGVFLKNGWQSFVSYHCLKVGDFLVFRYDRSYSFVVKIFGTNGCKKETFAATNIATHVKIEEKTEEEIEAKQTSCKRARQHKEDHLLRGNERTEMQTVYFPNVHISFHLARIPNEVIKIHKLRLKLGMVLRNANGEEWPVRVYTLKDGRTYIGKGWLAFQKDNNMSFKDSCKFTFETERLSRTIYVQISRARPDYIA